MTRIVRKVEVIVTFKSKARTVQIQKILNEIKDNEPFKNIIEKDNIDWTIKRDRT